VEAIAAGAEAVAEAVGVAEAGAVGRGAAIPAAAGRQWGSRRGRFRGGRGLTVGVAAGTIPAAAEAIHRVMADLARLAATA